MGMDRAGAQGGRHKCRGGHHAGAAAAGAISGNVLQFSIVVAFWGLTFGEKLAQLRSPTVAGALTSLLGHGFTFGHLGAGGCALHCSMEGGDQLFHKDSQRSGVNGQRTRAVMVMYYPGACDAVSSPCMQSVVACGAWIVSQRLLVLTGHGPYSDRAVKPPASAGGPRAQPRRDGSRLSGGNGRPGGLDGCAATDRHKQLTRGASPGAAAREGLPADRPHPRGSRAPRHGKGNLEHTRNPPAVACDVYM